MTCPKTGQTEDDAWQGHLAILPTAPKGGVFEICERTPCCTPLLLLLLQLSSCCSFVFCANLSGARAVLQTAAAGRGRIA